MPSAPYVWMYHHALGLKFAFRTGSSGAADTEGGLPDAPALAHAVVVAEEEGDGASAVRGKVSRPGGLVGQEVPPARRCKGEDCAKGGLGKVGSRLVPKAVSHGQCDLTSPARLGSTLVVWSHSHQYC